MKLTTKRCWGLVIRKDIFAKVGDEFSIVYTPLHGAGAIPVVHVLEEAGVQGLSLVESQMMADSKFSTVRSPNPEETDALERAIALAKEKKADLVMGTDPDCDRLGCRHTQKRRNLFDTYRKPDRNAAAKLYTAVQKRKTEQCPSTLR